LPFAVSHPARLTAASPATASAAANGRSMAVNVDEFFMVIPFYMKNFNGCGDTACLAKNVR
jgi:hypothetical protein